MVVTLASLKEKRKISIFVDFPLFFVGAVLDRNGLRPSRFYITNDNLLVMASEVGVYDVPAENIVLKSRLKPGRMLLVDTQEKCFIQDVQLKSKIAKLRPHSEWLQEKVKIFFSFSNKFFVYFVFTFNLILKNT